MIAKTNRLRELDFLRGLAIILVLFRHQFFFEWTQNMGWIGVDLFFVLSGFLVSGLLFKEYLKFGDIKPKNFLIRRGFKIYPIYFIFYCIYLNPYIFKYEIQWHFLVADLIFIQNYIHGWGYAYPASWSLAVEEHFYFGLAFLLWMVIRKKTIKLEVDQNNTKISKVEKIILISMVLCLIMRIVSNVFFSDQESRNFTMTHLRIDSLLVGVFIAYLYYFRKDYLRNIFYENKYLLFTFCILGVIWTPFIDPVPSFFAKTLGFTLLFISFGIILTYFLLKDEINEKLNHILSKGVVDAISKIGYCSYSIYIIHSFVNFMVREWKNYYQLYYNPILYFIVTSSLSILIGIIMTKYIEKFFLNIRDKYYPARGI